MEKAHVMTLSLSFDHRAIDGAPAAKFLKRIKHYIENPKEVF
ncbi:2-oxo acid dehydrogenase subunit E2 [Thermococcus sp.]